MKFIVSAFILSSIDGLLDTAKKYCRSPLMVVAMNEWYCCYDPKRNKDATPQKIKHEDEVASPALDKILTERIMEIGKERFERFSEVLEESKTKYKFKAFSKRE